MDSKQQLKLFKNKVYFLLLAALAIYLVYASRTVISRLGIAVLIMVILDPLVKYFMRFSPRRSRLIAIIITFAFLGFIILLVLARLIPVLITQLNAAIASLNSAAEQASKSGISLSQALANNNPTSSINALLPYLSNIVPSILSFITETISSLLNGLFAQLMVFGFGLFGLIEGPTMVKTLKKLLPKKQASEIIWNSRNLYNSITSYITGNLFISLVAGFVSVLFCLIIKLPYPLLMGVAVAICDLIPMFGAYLFGLVLGLFSFLFLGWDAAIISVVYVILYQQFENQILSPIVYNKANKLSPLTVLVVVSIGGAVAGLLGALIAIPIGSTAQLALNRYVVEKNQPKKAE